MIIVIIVNVCVRIGIVALGWLDIDIHVESVDVILDGWRVVRVIGFRIGI